MKRVMRMVCTAGKAEEFLQSVAIYTVASPFFQEVIVTVIRVRACLLSHTCQITTPASTDGYLRAFKDDN